MLLVGRDRAQPLVGGLDQLGLAGTHHIADPRRHVDPQRIALAQRSQQRQPGRVPMRHRDPLEEAIVARDFDGAPVGELGDEELRHALERPPIVRRVRQQLTGAGKQAVGELGALHIGDVLDRGHRVQDLAGGALDRARLRPRPALLPRLEVDGAQRLRLGGLAAERPPARERLRCNLVAALVTDRVLLTGRLGGGRDRVLGGLVAEHPGRGRVGEHELPVGTLDHDRLIEDRHHGVHPPLDALEVGKEPGVVERQTDTAREDLAKAHVLGVVHAPRPGGDQGQGAEVAAPRADRDHDPGTRVHPSQELEVVLRGGHPPQLLLPDVRAPLREMAPRALAAHQPLGQRRGPATESVLELLGVLVAAGADGDPRCAAAVADRVDDADIRRRSARPPRSPGAASRPAATSRRRPRRPSPAAAAARSAPPSARATRRRPPRARRRGRSRSAARPARRRWSPRSKSGSPAPRRRRATRPRP